MREIMMNATVLNRINFGMDAALGSDSLLQSAILGSIIIYFKLRTGLWSCNSVDRKRLCRRDETSFEYDSHMRYLKAVTIIRP